jgi:uncharacterized BrkB/YihY/UPF0761 family membrane protein
VSEQAMLEVIAGIFGILVGGFALWTSYDEAAFKRWVRSKPRWRWSLERERAGALFVGIGFILIGILILLAGAMKLRAL